jgi:hypothetical protein
MLHLRQLTHLQHQSQVPRNLLRKPKKLLLHRPRLQQMPQHQPQLFLRRFLVFLARVTTRSRHRREWAFLVRWLDQPETTHSRLHATEMVLADQVALVQLALVLVRRVVRAVLVRLVLVAQVAQALLAHAQVSAAVQVPVAQERVASAHLVQVAGQTAAVVAVVLPVHSVRAAARTRLESRSAKSAKHSNRDLHRALVERLFRAAMATLSFVCAAVRASKTSQTRLMPTQAS